MFSPLHACIFILLFNWIFVCLDTECDLFRCDVNVQCCMFFIVVWLIVLCFAFSAIEKFSDGHICEKQTNKQTNKLGLCIMCCRSIDSRDT